MHTLWCLSKKRTGWRHGKEYSYVDKLSQDLVTYSQVPLERKRVHTHLVTSMLTCVFTTGFRITRQDAQKKITGSVCREALQCLDFFSIAVHDQWVAWKQKERWNYDRQADHLAKTHPSLKPFYHLDDRSALPLRIIGVINITLLSLSLSSSLPLSLALSLRLYI